MLHQQRTQPQLLPFFGDCHGTFTFVLTRGAIAAHADLDQSAILVGQCDVRHALFIFFVHRGRAWLFAVRWPARESACAGTQGQAFDEGVFTLAVFIRQLPDQYVTTIPGASIQYWPVTLA
jgi:hypothetical protein